MSVCECIGILAYSLVTFIIMAYCTMKSVSVVLAAKAMPAKATSLEGGWERSGRRGRTSAMTVDCSLELRELQKYSSQLQGTSGIVLCLHCTKQTQKPDRHHIHIHIYIHTPTHAIYMSTGLMQGHASTTHKLMSIACSMPFVIFTLLFFPHSIPYFHHCLSRLLLRQF